MEKNCILNHSVNHPAHLMPWELKLALWNIISVILLSINSKTASFKPKSLQQLVTITTKASEAIRNW